MRTLPFKAPHIALAIPPVSGHTQRILRGVGRFASEFTAWTFEFSPWDHYTYSPKLQDADGVIGLTSADDVAATLAASGLPTINIGAVAPNGPCFPTVFCEHASISQLVVRDFIERGFEHVAFVGELARDFVRPRYEAMLASCEEQGLFVRSFDMTAFNGRPAELAEALIAWLEGLPIPIGVLAQNDLKGRDVLNACRLAGLRVPEDVAVIGVDDDEVLCHLTPPPLSSVRQDSERIGYEAARMLDALMRGDTRTPIRLALPPLGLVTRQSSDNYAIEDPDVVTALRFMRDHLAEGIDIRDVLERVPVSRRWLEKQFQRYLGRTPAEELRRLRIERAKTRLVGSTMSMLEIALNCGFGNQATFSVSFKREVGLSPAAYRRERTGSAV